MACLSAQVHYCGNESDIDTVEEIATTCLTMLVGIAYAAKVNLAHTTLLDRKSVV